MVHSGEMKNTDRITLGKCEYEEAWMGDVDEVDIK
jgi:hypothetical protein